MQCGLITLILTSLVLPASALLKTGLGNKWPSFTNVIITTDILHEVSNIGSDAECVSLCLKNESCVSVFYRTQHRRCQLHDVLFMSPLDGQEETGTVYYSLTTGACPPGYILNRLLNFCYQLHLNKILYVEGLADCSSRGEHFLVIDSLDKQSHFVKQAAASSDSKTSSYYIDGSDVATEGQWLFYDSRPMSYFDWGPGYPKNLSAERDYLSASKQDSAFQWHDRKKDETKFYICEKDV